MRRIGIEIAEFDIVEHFSGAPPFVVQLLFGLGCTALMVGGRAPVDVLAPTAGPFALIYPAILIATLFGRWPAGIVTLATAFLYV